MAVGQYHAQVIIGMDSGLPDDVCVNNFSFSNDDAGTTRDADASEIISRLNTFYGSVDAKWANTVDTANVRVKVYDRGDPAPRVPIANELLTGLTAGSSGPGPSEVAVCISFHGLIVSGDIPARKKGRIYFGPIGQDDMGARPSSALRSALNDAAAALFADNVTGELSWGVRSDSDDQTSPVVGGYVDDAWDVQRRRGLAPTARTPFGT